MDIPWYLLQDGKGQTRLRREFSFAHAEFEMRLKHSRRHQKLEFDISEVFLQNHNRYIFQCQGNKI